MTPPTSADCTKFWKFAHHLHHEAPNSIRTIFPSARALLTASLTTASARGGVAGADASGGTAPASGMFVSGGDGEQAASTSATASAPAINTLSVPRDSDVDVWLAITPPRLTP